MNGLAKNKEIVNKMTWISIKDRTPLTRGTYLVERDIPHNRVCLSFFYENDYTWGCFGNVVNWMPLPAPTGDKYEE